MGTSTGYQMPTGGDWTPLKHNANRFVKDDSKVSPITPKQLVQGYLRAVGGSQGMAAQGGGEGGVSSGGAGRSGASQGGARIGSAIGVGRSLGGFLSRVGTAGLTEALKDFGLGHLVGHTASEVATGLLDALAGPASTIDDGAARDALTDLNNELLKDAVSADDVERLLTTSLDAHGLGGVLMRFFALYIYHRFCRDFYERWVKAAGPEATKNSLRSVRGYIDAALRLNVSRRDVSNIGWHGEEGARVARDILADTCAVYGVPT